MSVLIEGMKKPISCETCCMYDDGKVECRLNGYDVYEATVEMRRHRQCPIVEVPTPHGRLIDADRLIRKEIQHLLYHLPNGDMAIPQIDIEHAPTVIEAEE